MKKFFVQVKRFVRDEDGASMVEYGLLVSLIAVTAIIATTAVGTAVNGIFTTVAGAL